MKKEGAEDSGIEEGISKGKEFRPEILARESSVDENEGGQGEKGRGEGEEPS